jgi:hypothetical protein
MDFLKPLKGSSLYITIFFVILSGYLSFKQTNTYDDI